MNSINPGDMVRLIPQYKNMKAYLGLPQLDRFWIDKLADGTFKSDGLCEYHANRIDVVYSDDFPICCPTVLLEVVE